VIGRRTVAALLAVAAVFTGGSKCERKVPSNRPEVDRQVDPSTRREVVITARSKQAPYEVLVDAHELDQGGRPIPGRSEHWREMVADTEHPYTQKLVYTSGLKVRIRVEVKPPRLGSDAECAIRDGDWNRDRATDYGGWRAICSLDTAR
jgi:hypothetical protein